LGSKAKVIVFSDGTVAKLDFTKDKKELDEVILTDCGGGTVCPIEDFKESKTKNRGQKRYIIFTTDTGLANATETLEAVKEIIRAEEVIGMTVFVQGYNAGHYLEQEFHQLGIPTWDADPEIVRGKTLEVIKKYFVLPVNGKVDLFI
jgi:hypothetical protein